MHNFTMDGTPPLPPPRHPVVLGYGSTFGGKPKLSCLNPRELCKVIINPVNPRPIFHILTPSVQPPKKIFFSFFSSPFVHFRNNTKFISRIQYLHHGQQWPTWLTHCRCRCCRCFSTRWLVRSAPCSQQREDKCQVRRCIMNHLKNRASHKEVLIDDDIEYVPSWQNFVRSTPNNLGLTI